MEKYTTLPPMTGSQTQLLCGERTVGIFVGQDHAEHAALAAELFNEAFAGIDDETQFKTADPDAGDWPAVDERRFPS